MYLIDEAKAAMEELGITPVIVPIRGGTDGARLSYMAFPAPTCVPEATISMGSMSISVQNLWKPLQSF